jgi:hypothetical protein
MALGGLLCLLGIVLVCKIRDSRAAAETTGVTAESPDPTKGAPPAVEKTEPVPAPAPAPAEMKADSKEVPPPDDAGPPATPAKNDPLIVPVGGSRTARPPSPRRS